MKAEPEVVAHLSADFDPDHLHAVVHALEDAYGGPLCLLLDPQRLGLDVVRDPA